MQGTILIIDGVSTNRILLKVQLTDACFQVIQADSIATALEQATRVSPDLVLTALTLPDGGAGDVKRGLCRLPQLADVPVIALGASDDRQTRLAALAAGVDEVLAQPVDDMILQARIRSLLRRRLSEADLHLQEDRAPAFRHRMVAPPSPPSAETSVALVCSDLQTAQKWKARLIPAADYGYRAYTVDAIQDLMRTPVPDVIVIELNEGSAGLALRLLADLRARATTRDSVVIAVPNPADAMIAAEALDRGAHDVLHGGFQVEELLLRISIQLRHRRSEALLRASLRNDLKAANEDPMTGLYNRRYAKPFLDRVVEDAGENGEVFAVMMADLDHFKRINDNFGHPAGDAVLVEAARRLRAELRGCDLLARVGGEEFMVVLPGIRTDEAHTIASRLCAAISREPFQVPGSANPVPVTVSIGAVVGGGRGRLVAADDMIAAADRALYDAKHAGRNRVSIKTSPQSAAA